MTTFDIDNTQKTKYLEVLESLVEQGHSLRAIHSPQTWRLSALTFALHLHDSIILFGKLKEKWAQRLPLSEAWDVDFTEWKNRIWSLVNNVSSFTEDSEYSDWQHLCEEDYHTFIEKANGCLFGVIPLKELMVFLSEKNTELKNVIIDSGQVFSTLLSDIETMLYNSSTKLYELFYDDLVGIYMNENENPYQIEENGIIVAYERWKASKSKKRLPDLLLSKIKAVNSAMLDIKFWQETWGSCFDIEKREIDKEGFARYIFQNRKRIIESKQYLCKNCLGRCFGTLCLCEHLWQEHDQLQSYVVNENINLLDEIAPIIESCKKYLVKDIPQTFLRELIEDILESDIKSDLHIKPGNSNNYITICKIIGAIKDSNKVFDLNKTTKKLAHEIQIVINGVSFEKILDYIKKGKDDHESNIWKWTIKYINNKLRDKSL